VASASGLETEIKALIVDALALEDVQPEEIENASVSSLAAFVADQRAGAERANA
jgi:hypothetical protein